MRLKDSYTQRKYKTNRYDLTGEYGICYTKDNQEILFDLEDYDKIKDYFWRLNDKGYAVTASTRSPFKRMHNLIMGFKGIDHKNRNRLDNRKENLRKATPVENMQNRKIQSNNHQLIKVTGVRYRKERSKWEARIKYKNKIIILAYTDDVEEAIIARLKAEKKYYGEFAPQQHLFKQYNII